MPRVPWNIVEDIELFEDSKVARDAFGEEVHLHLVRTAKQEWLRFNGAVTDWELQRSFERI